MAIGDDFKIDYNYKRIYHDSGTTVYSANALYSWIMDTFDELTQLDDTVPMSAQTPTAYTMINGWFIDDESTKYLSGGAIKSSGYAAGVIRMLQFGGTYTNAVPSDVTKPVVGVTTSDSGRLLAYNNTTKKWWIRPDDSGDEFDVSETVNVTGGSGTGTTTGASATGEDLYANIYTLGTIESNPAPQVYIFQAGSRIAEWSTLSNFDRGHVDVLIKVKEMGSWISSAIITVYARQYGDLYDNFEIDLTDGGRNAVPLATAVDLNNVTGEYYLLYDAETVAFSTMNQIVTGGTSGAKAELVAVTDWGTTGLLTLVDVQGTFADDETITGSANGSADVNGTVGDTYLLYDGETSGFTVDETLTGGTSGAKRLIKGIQDDGVAGKLVLKVRSAPTVDDYKNYSDDEAITSAGGAAVANGISTTIVAGYSDIIISFVNGTVTHGAITGTFTANEPVTWTGGGTGVFVKENAGTMTLANCNQTTTNGDTITGTLSGATTVASADISSAHTTTKAFEQGAPHNYDVVVDCKTRTLAKVYEYFKFVCRAGSLFQMYTVVSGVITPLDGQEYIIAYTGYAPVKAAPFGSFAGGKLFGARGVWVENMSTGDVMNYQLIDSDGTTQNPPTYATITVASVVSGDRVAVFRTSAGAIDKAMYTSHATNNTIGIGTFETQEALSTDTPSSGYLRVVDTSSSTEQRYQYDSWSGKIFTLHSGVTLDRTYDGTDKAYVPFIDQQATATSVYVTVIYASDRAVLIRVRKKGILPFETPGSVTSSGLSVSAIRTEDAIVT